MPRVYQQASGVLVIRILCLTVSRRRTGFIAIFDVLYAFETGVRRTSNHAIEYEEEYEYRDAEYEKAENQ